MKIGIVKGLIAEAKATKGRKAQSVEPRMARDMDQKPPNKSDRITQNIYTSVRKPEKFQVSTQLSPIVSREGTRDPE
jgi:hypothetical protein